MQRPVTQQPFSTNFGGGGVRPGLEILAGQRRIKMKQKIEPFELLTGWQLKNRFKLYDENEQYLGRFVEDSTCLQRQCCKNGRAFTAKIVDKDENIMFQMERPCHCMCLCCPNAMDGFCGQECTVTDANGQFISKVTQNNGCTNTCACLCCCYNMWSLNVTDAGNQLKYKLERDMCHATCIPCCDSKDLHIVDPHGNKVGEIWKYWRGCAIECCTPADGFTMTFPEKMTAEEKAGMICALLLTDFCIYEQQNNQN